MVAPLDWGLGHATRCIPIIKLLIAKGCTVSIASSGNALKLLREEFPNLIFFNLPSYGAVYSKYIPFMLYIFLQLPKFLLVIGRERGSIKKIISKHSIDLIISDNRYGCRESNVQSVFICHQINIIMPLGYNWFSPIVNYFNHRWIMKFNQCWIPDDLINPISGKLSNPGLPNSIYVGLLSRFGNAKMRNIVYHLVVILSGPEPQRTIFEDKILNQLKEVQFKTMVVRGVLDKMEEKTEGNVTLVNHLPAIVLQQVIDQSEVVLCRAGYSSLMDLARLERKAILVPTPGQTEQEYLGKSMMKRKIAFSQSQKDFDLLMALSEIKNYIGFEGWSSQPNLLEEVLDNNLK
ncbi:MAG TPA: glycosyltransferase [Cyclobacteriaceae bacterium]